MTFGANDKSMKIKTKFQDEGINKRTISLEDQQKLIIEGKEIEEINYEGTEIEKKVINRGTNALIVSEFMEESIKDPNGVLPGKTVFFSRAAGAHPGHAAPRPARPPGPTAAAAGNGAAWARSNCAAGV